MFNRDLREQIKKLEQQLEHITKRFEKLEDYYIDSKYHITEIAQREVQSYINRNQISVGITKKDIDRKFDKTAELLTELIDKTGFRFKSVPKITKELLEKKSKKKPKGGD